MIEKLLLAYFNVAFVLFKKPVTKSKNKNSQRFLIQKVSCKAIYSNVDNTQKFGFKIMGTRLVST